jgi:diguanylate cyclase (GGDEF)-like protein
MSAGRVVGNAMWLACRFEDMGVHSWMFGEIDRERMLDMDRRVAPVRRNAMAVLGIALLLSAPWLGWWTLAPLVLAVALFQIADRQARRVTHPEYVIFGAWIGSEAIIASSVALSGGPKVATLAWLAIPIVTLPARFTARVVGVGVALALGLLVVVAFVTDTHAVLRNPPLVIAPAALIVAVAMLSMALMRSDIEHRSECVIDQLTGLLNRRALASRAEELLQQSAVTGEPVGVIAGDVDCFKTINDRDGHTAGDTALAWIAARLRDRLRAFDLLYRLGGDEFVVLLPGADLSESETVADSLRTAVDAECLPDGWPVSMSFGVSASARGELFRYRDVFTAADAALYEAKREGRDRVCASRSAGRSARGAAVA